VFVRRWSAGSCRVEVVEHKSRNLGDLGGLHRGKGEDQSRGKGGGRRHGTVDVGGRERLEHAVLVLADLEAADGVAENAEAYEWAEVDRMGFWTKQARRLT
jgi:hypothetical protein